MDNQPKHIVVTGASRGIGRALTVWLCSQGHFVTALARSSDALRSLQTEIGKNGTVATVDLSSVESVSAFAASLHPAVDGIVHNAGLLVNKPFHQLSDSDWYAMWDTNVMGTVRLTRALLPVLKKGAHVVLVSSMGGFQGSSKYPGLSGYATTKGAVSVLAECLAVELTSLEIRCNALCLGAVQTEMLSEAFPGYNAPVKPEQMAAFIGTFTLESHHIMNGKVLPVALSNP